ncbi:MAG TPA: EF-hand domain-containing protein [Methylomirabilota bacterium]|nr:EF-hand domain-containing protein [Methylomirabilota bacterium]
MNSRLLLMLCLGLTTLTALAADSALRPEPTSPPRSPQEARERFMKRYDKNGDGQISDEERKTMIEERRKENEAREKERLKKYDKNGDGKLDDTERAAAREDFLKARRAATNNVPPTPTTPAPAPATPQPNAKTDAR